MHAAPRRPGPDRCRRYWTSLIITWVHALRFGPSCSSCRTASPACRRWWRQHRKDHLLTAIGCTETCSLASRVESGKERRPGAMARIRLQVRLLLAVGVLACALVLAVQRRLLQHHTPPP